MTREEWLQQAVEALRPMFRDNDAELPEHVYVSCGFPGGRNINKVIGQCWASKASNGTAQLFISPMLEDVTHVLETLVHELIHAWDDCEHGHTGPFRKLALNLGLEGRMTATVAGESLRNELVMIADRLGEYPHRKITPGAKTAGPKKQGTRMIKLECPADGYTCRTTQKWIDLGTPTCPCGTEMSVAGQGGE